MTTQRRSPVVREDMMLVTVDGDPVPWGRAEGGRATARRGRVAVSDLVLKRCRFDDGAPALVALAHRVGRRATITVAHLDPNASPTGGGLAYEGVLKEVLPATCDANSYAVAEDRIVLRVKSVRALDV